jgi:hypothetical protein
MKTTTQEQDMTTAETLRASMRRMIEAQTTNMITTLLVDTINQMEEHAVGTPERSNLGVVYIMIAEVLEDRIGTLAVEAIEDATFGAIA